MNNFLPFIIFILAIGFIAWMIYDKQKKKKEKIQQIEIYIKQIEKNPSSASNYDNFIKACASNIVEPEDLSINGWNSRIVKICRKNPSYVKSWELFGFAMMKSGTTRCGEETIDLITNTLISEFSNSSSREKLISLIKIMSLTNKIDTKKLYDQSLDLVTTNSNDPHTKTLALELGRLHYSINRENKSPTIYDEQAIQNDILVRSR